MKKRAVALIMAAVMAFGLAGCGSGESTAQSDFTPSLSADESVTLNIVGYLSNFEALDAVINDFSEYYPNCEIVYSTVDDYAKMLESRLRSDASIDIFMANSTVYDYEYVANSCADLSALDIDLSAIREDALSAATADGKLYTLPLARITNGMAVNESLLEECGLEVPTTYDEFLNACEVLLQAGYTPIVGWQDWMYSILIKNMVYVELAQTGDEEAALNGMIAAEDSCTDVVRPAFERAWELTQKGYIDPEVNNHIEDSYNTTLLRFLEGDIPFMVMNSETFSGMAKRETRSEAFSANPFTYSFRCVPLAEDDCYSYLENWHGFSVNTYGEHQEWAIEFMRFLATEEEINQMASVKGLPSVAKNSDDAHFASIYAKNEENQVNSAIYVPIDVQNALDEGIKSIGTAGNTVDEALAVVMDKLKNPSE